MELKRDETVFSPMSDDEIIKLYWMRNENAIIETELKYRNYLFSVAYHIVHDHLDCEECLNDTYMGAWNAMPPSRPHNLKAFLTTIMRRIAVNRYHKNTRKKSIPTEMTVSLSELEGVLFNDGDVDDRFDAKRLGKVISDYIRTLSAHRRFIFMSRYYVAEPVDTIADELGLSRSTIQKELAAIKSGLKEILESEGYSI